MGSIRVEKRPDGCCTLVLDNERRKNALDVAMLRGLQEALAALAEDAACRVVVLRGQGENFCAGRDISELGASDEPQSDATVRADFVLLRGLTTALYHFPKPTLAIVRGYALGLGLVLVTLCDVAIAEDTARLGIPEAKVGVPPSLTAVALTRAAPLKAATRMLFTGALIDAGRAERIGLISEVVTANGLEVACETLLRELLDCSPMAVQLCKELVRATEHEDFAVGVDQALKTAMRGLRTADAIEGRLAFMEKRRPAWGIGKPV